MNHTTQKISVLMSVYNGSRYLRESIESILNQTFTDFEFIIIDDFSTDNTWEILTEYANQDHRIVLIKNEQNIGLTKSLNKGLKIAKGKYIARQDADDISLLNRLKKEVFLLDRQPEVVLVSCEIEYIDSEGYSGGTSQRACHPDLIPWYLLFYNYLGGHSQIMFRREPILKLYGYCEDYRYAQDYELWCRVAEIGKIVILPEILLKYRCHSKTLSSEKKLEQEAYVIAQVRHNIQKITGKILTAEESKNLTYFWLSHENCWRNYFPVVKS